MALTPKLFGTTAAILNASYQNATHVLIITREEIFDEAARATNNECVQYVYLKYIIDGGIYI